MSHRYRKVSVFVTAYKLDCDLEIWSNADFVAEFTEVE